MLTSSSRSRSRWRIIVPIVVVVAAVAVGVPMALGTGKPTLTLTGLQNGQVLGKQSASSLDVQVAAKGVSSRSLKVTMDGHPAATTASGSGLRVDVPTPLAAGAHTITVTAAGHGLHRGASITRTFSVDLTPPTLKVDAPASAPSLRSPVTLTGSVDGATSVTAGGTSVPVKGDRFTLSLPAPPAALKVVATDAAGNATTDVVTVPVTHPQMRGVHLTGYGWNATVLRNPVLALAKAHKINTVELDIKEEDGYVNYATSVTLAHQIGAVRKLYDPKAVIAQLHGMGVRVVGRIVCFRDPKLAAWAWAHGHRDWDVQSPSGGAYNSSKYGAAAFTNWANAQVQKYNIDLAVEGAKLGFDDVMYDYVRRPDGPLKSMKFPGAKVTAPVGVANFVKDTSGPLRAQGAYLGLAVFGVSATRPKEVGQDIGLMAKYVDYVAPMVYPSHWGPGEYGVANPNAQPYPIVNRSLKDFQKKVAGTTAQVMPWLQDFSLGVHYGVAQVQAQIKGAADDHIGSFLLWNAGCDYQGGALAVDPALPRTTD